MAVNGQAIRWSEATRRWNGVSQPRSVRRGAPARLVSLVRRPSRSEAVLAVIAGSLASALTFAFAYDGPAGPAWAIVTAILTGTIAVGLAAAIGTVWDSMTGAYEAADASLFEVVLADNEARRVARVLATSPDEAVTMLAKRSSGAAVEMREIARLGVEEPRVLRLGSWIPSSQA